MSDSEINKRVKAGIPPSSNVTRRNKRKEDMDESIIQQFADMKEKMRKIMSLFSTTQGKEILTTLQEIKQSNQNIEASISFLTAQNDEFKKKIEHLENQAKDDRRYIAILENKMEDMQVLSRKANFELKNVPKKNNETKEDLIEMVVCLSQSIDCKITRSDIRDIYRVRGKLPD